MDARQHHLPDHQHLSPYDTLSQYGRSAVVKTTATLPIDAGLNIRALLALTGDDPTGVPEGATVTYKGNADADLTTYVDMNSRLPVPCSTWPTSPST